jgi:uncharacterized spore protein YtfJ
MSDSEGVKIIAKAIPDQESGNKLLEKLLDKTNARAVFNEPIEVGEYKVITAAEVTIGLGFGYGGGGGIDNPETEKKLNEDNIRSSKDGSFGYGGGGGGGGGAVARPVAAIEIGPHGVRVEPIVDPTKIALAFFTTLLSMFTMFRRMRKD